MGMGAFRETARGGATSGGSDAPALPCSIVSIRRQLIAFGISPAIIVAGRNWHLALQQVAKVSQGLSLHLSG
jgi:hypothetical protein